MTEPAVWYGQLTTRRRLLARGGALIAGGVTWLSVFLLLPSLALLVVSFVRRDADGALVWELTLESFERIFGSASGENARILIRSILLALAATTASVLLAYPMSFFIARGSRRRRFFWLAMVIVPLCTNLVIRTFSWKLLLSAQLPPAKIAAWLGWVDPGRDIYPSWVAVTLGMIAAFLPFAVVPLYTSIDRLDWSQVEAAQDLYASRLRVFLAAILPQTLPGLSVAVILTFVPAMSVFVVSDMLGGAKHWLIGNLIQHQFGPGRNIPYGAALSLILIVLTLGGVALYRRNGRSVELL
ncbi:ABC transporter permease [Sorangium cellulosum]|uniref:ABC transporter permease n=1 Tax=Sorangium cellulosum TaxID=56 RepID=A0A2L0FBZ5_SORCE|nr:ABC transporter permease [Sorangium cellulosum]AUX49027.1 ABC transporter permease [Sorangium cellulosum]